MFAQCSAAIKRALIIISILRAPSRHITTPTACSPCPLPVPQIPSSPGAVVTITVMATYLHLYCFASSASHLSPAGRAPLWASPSQIRISSRAHTVGSRACSNQCLFSPAQPQAGHISQLPTVKAAGELLPCGHCLLTRNIPSWGTLLAFNKEQSTPQRDSSCQRQVGRKRELVASRREVTSRMGSRTGGATQISQFPV